MARLLEAMKNEGHQQQESTNDEPAATNNKRKPEDDAVNNDTEGNNKRMKKASGYVLPAFFMRACVGSATAFRSSPTCLDFHALPHLARTRMHNLSTTLRRVPLHCVCLRELADREGKEISESDNNSSISPEPPNSPPLVYVPVRHGPAEAALTRLLKDDRDLSLSNNNLEVMPHS